jgi:hypothetical protein
MKILRPLRFLEATFIKHEADECITPAVLRCSALLVRRHRRRVTSLLAIKLDDRNALT